jgi:hypothetical protein
MEHTWPPGYVIRRQALRVVSSGTHLTEEEARLMASDQFRAGSGAGGAFMELDVEKPIDFAHYGFEWEPPTEAEYQQFLREAAKGKPPSRRRRREP